MNLPSIIRRRSKPVQIQSRNTELFVQTVYYKDNPRAVWNMLLIFGMVAFAFIAVMFMDSTVAVILVALLFAAPVYAAISGKTWFSFNASHDKPLIFEPDALQVGDEYFTLPDLQSVTIFIHSFYGFRYHKNNLPGGAPPSFDDPLKGYYTSEYGDKNELTFSANGQQYQCRFLLGSGTAWYALYEIMKAWQQQGVVIDLKENYSYDFVHGEVMRAANDW
jgi:hypothetical protein